MDNPDLGNEPDWCNVMNLLPLLLEIEMKDGNLTVTPSRFMSEMRLSTEERLERLVHPARKTKEHELGTRIFKAMPEIVIFQNFKPGITCTIPLRLLNIKKVTKPLKLVMEPSGFFTVKHNSDIVCSKVAPGMSYQLEVSFLADSLRDYSHKITFLTEGESIVVNLVAIGPRPLLDLPDLISLPTTAIDIKTERTILVRNLGAVPAIFTVHTSSPFTVKPLRGTLQPNELLQLTVYFKPTSSGLSCGDLVFLYETGERLSIKVEGVGEEASLRTDECALLFEDTYLGLTSQKNWKIYNDNDYPVRFKWKNSKEVDVEMRRLQVLQQKFEDMRDYEACRDNQLEYYGIASGDTNRKIYDRILQDEVKGCDTMEVFGYDDCNFVISPMEGEIWPKSSVEFSVFFIPKSVDEHQKIGYLQVTGLSERIPVMFEGICKGPSMALNVEEIDAQEVYIDAIHKYEVIFCNIGPIPATINYLSNRAEFGGYFQCSERRFEVKANTTKSVCIEFRSSTRGKFLETIPFEIVQSHEMLSFSFKGTVVCPLLTFDGHEVDFGNVPFGYPIVRDITLVNGSQVDIEYILGVSHDGHYDAITLEQYAEMDFKPMITADPKEFSLQPNGGMVEAFQKESIQITLVSNTLSAKKVTLVVIMWGSLNNNRTIPIKYQSHIPTITSSVRRIELKSMFITQPYLRLIQLRNESAYPGFVSITTTSANDELQISVDTSSGYVEAYGFFEFSVILQTDEIGAFTGSLSMAIFGDNICQHEFCEVSVHSRGPCIDLEMERMALGKIATLTLIEKHLEITNDSPIAARVMVETYGDFISTPVREFLVEAEKSAILILRIYGTYPGRFKNVLKLMVLNGDTDTYPIVGTCVGSSILCEPWLEPEFQIGFVLSQTRYTHDITITNKGKEHHSMCWTQSTVNMKKFKDVTEPDCVFRVVPNQFELNPGESIVIRLVGFYPHPCFIKETFTVYAKLSKRATIYSIMTFDVSATFRDPCVTFNKRFLEFRCDFGVDTTVSFLKDIWVLVNQTGMSISIEFVIDKYFSFILDAEGTCKESMTVTLAADEQYSVLIQFQPPVQTKRCFTIEGYIRGRFSNHPNKIAVPVVGIVNYPTIELNPPVVDFDCVSFDQTAYRFVLLSNISPLPVTYQFEWMGDDNFYLGHLDAKTFNEEPESCECPDNCNNVCTTSQSSIVDDPTMAMLHIITPLLDEFISEIDQNDLALYSNIVEPSKNQLIHRMFDLVPNSGHLEPYECQYLSMRVRPPYKTMMNCKAVCWVDGGEGEALFVQARSCEISYLLKSHIIDCGIVVINHIIKQQFTITNTGYGSFTYTVRYCESSEEFQPLAGWMSIAPVEGRLRAGEQVVFTISYFPGYIGLFTEIIELNIASKLPRILKLKGCATFPQVYFDLPRPGVLTYDMNLISYQAIADIVYQQHLNAEEIVVTCTGYDDWVFLVCEKNTYPSVMDIYLSLERIIGNDHLIYHPEIIADYYNSPGPHIPGLTMPPYILDMGYVIVNAAHEFPLTPVRYQPTAKIAWQKLPGSLIERGVNYVFLKNHDGPFLFFFPKSRLYPVLDQSMEFSVFANVFNGSKLEIHVKGIVTIPQIRFRENIINFGQTQCGFSAKKSMIMENCGNVPCHWTATVQCPTKKTLHIFYLAESKGTLEPGNLCTLDVFFQPRFHGKIEWVLTVTLEQNPDAIDALVRGYGLIPDLLIEENCVEFEPALPYSEDNVRTFTVTNCSVFPIEMFFADFDNEFEVEADMIRMILHYNNIRRMNVPVRGLGEPLPQNVLEFYNSLLDKLREILKSYALRDYYRRSTCGVDFKRLSVEYLPDPLEDKSRHEIYDLLIKNVVKVRKSMMYTKNITKKCSFYDFENTSSKDSLDMATYREGILIIFHGAPDTNYAELANKVGRQLNLPVYNIDQLIIYALINYTSLATIKVNDEIEKRLEVVASGTDLEFPPDFDDYDELEAKIALIIRGKIEKPVEKDIAPPVDKRQKSAKSGTKKSGSKKDSSKKANSKKDSKKSKKSTSSKKPKKIREPDTFLDLPLELFYEILNQQLVQCINGIVIESLDSLFIRKPRLVLFGVLRGMGNVRFLQCVYLSRTYTDCEVKKAAEVALGIQYTSEKQGRVAEITEMEADQFAALSDEDFNLFRQYVLQPRKLESLRKRSELQAKLEEEKLKKLKQVQGKKKRTTSGKSVKSSKSKTSKSKESVMMSSKKNSKPSKGSSKKSEKSSKTSSGGGKKSSKSSKNSSKRSKSSKTSKPEVVSLVDQAEKDALLAAEVICWELVHYMEHWNRTDMELIKPLPAKMPKIKPTKPKKPKKEKKAKGTSKKGSSKKSKGGNAEGESPDSVVKEEPKIQTKVLTEEEQSKRNNIGIPLLLLNNVQYTDDINILCESIVTYLNAEEKIGDAIYLLEESLQPKVDVGTALYTALSESPSYMKHQTNIFVLSDAPTVDSAENSSEESLKNNVSFNVTERTFTYRRILQPDEKVTYMVQFFPKECTEYTHVYNITTQTWPKMFPIKLNGKADIPRIFLDPHLLYSNVRRRSNYTLNGENCVYYADEQIFRLGPVLAQRNEPHRSCLNVEGVINLISDSFLQSKVSINFENEMPEFSVHQKELLIRPNNSDFLKVLGHPKTCETFENQLVLTIQNNPQVSFVRVSCIGVALEVDVAPNVLGFDRMILDTELTKSVAIQNKSQLKLLWVFTDDEDALRVYLPSKRRGLLQPMSEDVVDFTFVAMEVGTEPKSMLKVDFFDQNEYCETPIISECLQFSAETLQFRVDYETEVKLNDVKVLTQYTENYRMTNRTQVEWAFKFELISNENDSSKIAKIRSYFTIEPMKGVMKPNHPYDARIKFMALEPTEFLSLPIIACTYSDRQSGLPVHSFVISVSAHVFSSIFELCPPTEVDFGNLLVRTEVFREITLANHGKFQFGYAVISMRKLLKAQKLLEKQAKKGGKKGGKQSSKSAGSKKSTKSSKSGSKKSGKSSKTTSKKRKPTTLREGIFAVTSSTGVVEPGEEASIRVTCKPATVGDQSETVVVMVSETAGRESHGHNLQLFARGCIPVMDFENIDEIFKEVRIVDAYDNTNYQQEIGLPVYIKETSQLFFNKTYLNIPVTARIKIQSLSLIGATIYCQIMEGEDTFSVEPDTRHVDAYKHDCVEVTFKPASIETFYGVLQVSVNASDAVLVVKLSGEGYVPEVSVVQPTPNLYGNYSLVFNPLMIGLTDKKQVEIKNSGILPCKVLMGVINDDDDVLYLKPPMYPKMLTSICSTECLSGELKHTIMAALQPDETYTFEVQFKPTEEKSIASTVRLFIVNNPYELIDIEVTGQGYKEDVIFEGLPTVPVPQSLSTSSETCVPTSSTSYVLEYGPCCLNKMHKKYFRIKNTATTDSYKFVFGNLERLVFIPAIGHLNPMGYKDVIVTYFSKEPITYENVIINCRICKIIYKSPEFEPLSWDERQYFTIWQPIESDMEEEQEQNEPYTYESPSFDTGNVLKTIMEHSEPPIDELTETVQDIKINFSVVAHYTSYSVYPKEILMEDTLMFEKQSATFTFENLSPLPIPLYWTLRMHPEYPKRINQECKTEEETPTKQSVLIRPKTCVDSRRPQHLSGSERFIDNGMRPKSSQSSFYGSITSTSSVSLEGPWAESDIPLVISPNNVTISPNSSCIFTVTFSPYDVYDYAVYVQSDVHNLKPCKQTPEVLVRARSLLPLYHFNLEPTDYLSQRRQSREICGQAVNAGTKVIEFQVLGIGEAVTKEFSIINPTGEDFSYHWTRSSKGLSMFQCHKSEGDVTRGKMAWARFTFVSTQRGVFETIYTFHIEKYSLRTEFLLVGRVREACVFFEKQSITLKSTVVGIDVSADVLLNNQEDVPLGYKINRTMMCSRDRSEKLSAEPWKGVIEAKSSKAIKLTFRPTKVGQTVFVLECDVESLEKPLPLVVNNTSYKVEPKITYIGEVCPEEIDSENMFVIDKQSMIHKQDEHLKFTIANIGCIGFYYKWELPDNYIDDYVVINLSSVEGYVKSETIVEAVITLRPAKALSKKCVNLILKVVYGPTYKINLTCSTVKSKYKLSFKDYDFGRCLVQHDKSNFHEACLEIVNNDTICVVIDFPDSDYEHLTIINKAPTIHPKKSGSINFIFHPTKAQHYATDISFYINDKLERLRIFGEGVPLDIELEVSKNKYVNMGPVNIGKCVKERLRVINHSKCPVKIYFELYHRLPYFIRPRAVLCADYEVPEVKPSDIVVKKGKGKAGKGKKEKKSSKGSKSSKASKSKASSKKKSDKDSKKSDKKSKKGSNKSDSSKSKKDKKEKAHVEPVESPEDKQKRLIDAFVKIQPAKWIKVMSKQTTEFTISYYPMERMPTFTEQVFYQVQSSLNPICMFKTSCIAAEYYLEREKLSFGTVIIGCYSEHIVNLFNIGDIGGAYKWIIGKKQTFTITPAEGYIAPNMSVMFNVRFEPTRVYCLFKVMASLLIENYGKDIQLELLGTCISLPPPKETIKFSCPVRECQTKTITVANPSGIVWNINTSMSGQFFTTDDKMVIDPAGKTTAEITYAPLTMTRPEKPHEAKLFLPLPAGQGFLYELIGEAARPNPTQKLTLTIPSKTEYSQILEVNNWLLVPQRFTVINQIDQPDNPKKRVLYKLSGVSVIDVPINKSRPYKWTITTINEGSLKFKVKFRNETTNEYIQYDLDITVTKCTSLDEIKMTTCARQTTEHRLKLQNPIGEPAVFTVTSTSPCLHFDKIINIYPYSEVELLITYKPLVPTPEHRATLEATTTTLGTFPYEFLLTAYKEQSEPVVHLQAQLGLSVFKTISLHNSTEQKADFHEELAASEFTLQNLASINPGENGLFEIKFEPSELGAVDATLILRSDVLGEYVYPLIGNCIPPKPQGPFIIKHGGYTGVPFKNPFSKTAMFSFEIQPDTFELRTSSESLRSRSYTKILVGLNKDIGEYALTGKLTVTCLEDGMQDISWIMYLKT